MWVAAHQMHSMIVAWKFLSHNFNMWVISVLVAIESPFSFFLCSQNFILFLIINLFFIGVQFANIQNNTQCSSHQVTPSVPITHSPPHPPSSPSYPPCLCPRVRSLYVLSPFLFPTDFFSLPFYSLSLLFIFPKWMRTYNVCPSPIDLLHSAEDQCDPIYLKWSLWLLQREWIVWFISSNCGKKDFCSLTEILIIRVVVKSNQKNAR